MKLVSLLFISLLSTTAFAQRKAVPFSELARNTIASANYPELQVRWIDLSQIKSARKILELSEQAYARISNFYDGLRLHHGVKLYLVKDFKESKLYFPLNGFSYQGANLTGREIIIMNSAINNLNQEKNMEDLIAHEFSHAFIRAYNNIFSTYVMKAEISPRRFHQKKESSWTCWIDEGLATFASGQLAFSVPQLQKEDLNLFASDWDSHMSYNTAATVIDYLIEKFGKKFVFDIFSGFEFSFCDDYQQFLNHIESKLGGRGAYLELQKDWKLFLKTKYGMKNRDELNQMWNSSSSPNSVTRLRGDGG